VDATERGVPVAWQPDAGLLAALPLAAVVVDVGGRVQHANDAARAFFGITDDPRGEPLASALFGVAERAAVDEVVGHTLATGRWTGELPFIRRDGAFKRSDMTVTAIHQDGAVVGVLMLVQDVAGTQAHARQLAERLTRLAQVTAELLFAEDIDAVTKIVIEHLADAAGATVASLSIQVDDDTLALIGLRGGPEGAASRWETYPVDTDAPASEAFRTGRTVVLSGRDEVQARYPDLETAHEGERSMICLPLRVGIGPIGVITMSFPGRRDFDAAELDFFRVLADTCAQAIDRTRALADAADQASKLEFLADASAELASSLDYEATLKKVARLAVPWFADWCAIALEQDGELRTLAVAHVDQAKVTIAEDLQRRFPADPSEDRGTYRVLRSGQSVLTPEITDEMLAAAVPDQEQLGLLQQLNFRSALMVPLKIKDRVLGVITWVAGDGGRRFGPKDLAFGEDLGRRAAVAIDNAQLHSELREVAVRLQRAVLPNELPQTPGWDMAARYLPAGRTDAGGDFYDVVELGDGRLAFFVGDVMGRGVRAAAAMVQMRTAVRTLVAVEPAPEVVMSKLDMLFERYDFQLVTMVYAVADPASEQVVIANAGHPAPVVVHADGRIEELTASSGLLLGAGGSERSLLTVPFLPGDTLLTFTDGLIERRNEDIDVGQRRLLDAVGGALSGRTLAAGLTELIEAVRDTTSDDDVAAMAVRRTPLR
jgi:PAS domain S-box-containing protein